MEMRKSVPQRLIVHLQRTIVPSQSTGDNHDSPPVLPRFRVRQLIRLVHMPPPPDHHGVPPLNISPLQGRINIRTPINSDPILIRIPPLGIAHPTPDPPRQIIPISGPHTTHPIPIQMALVQPGVAVQPTHHGWATAPATADQPWTARSRSACGPASPRRSRTHPPYRAADRSTCRPAPVPRVIDQSDDRPRIDNDHSDVSRSSSSRTISLARSPRSGSADARPSLRNVRLPDFRTN